MKSLLYIKGSEITDVRLHKFLSFFLNEGYDLSFWGWSRKGKKNQMKGVKANYLLVGGGYGKSIMLFLFYLLWMIAVFIRCVFSDKSKLIIAIDFDSAFPVYLASKLRGHKYIYEVYDDFAIRYKFPTFIKRMISFIDHKIMDKSSCVVHVDENRVLYKNCKWIVIENTPNDIFNGKERTYDNIEMKFAVIGYLSNQRGVESIYNFALNNPDVKFLVVGRFLEISNYDKYKALSNIELFNFMPQYDLHKLLQNCCGIFSLYDPSVEINRLAASNKVYDAMMLGIPVITNKEVVNSAFIKNNNFGYVINYNYDDTWNCLNSNGFINNAIKKGTKGRSIYLQNFQFEKIVRDRFLPIINAII